MKISIRAIEDLLTQKFIENDYDKKVALSMSHALIRSELFWRKTHGLTRYSWILKNKISTTSSCSRNTITENIVSIDCGKLNWYHIAKNEVEQLCSFHKKNNNFQISILKNIFPSNAYIDYLETFQRNKIWAIIVWTTPRLVWVRGSGKRIVWTNPIWYTFPNEKNIIISDLSTSHIPLGKILQNTEKQNSQEEVLNNLWKIISANAGIDANGGFAWALLPFWWIGAEHKWFNISLFIELITSSLCGNRSENGDMIMITFHKNHPLYKIDGVNSMLEEMSSIDDSIRLPWQSSMNTYYNNLEREYITIDQAILDSLNLSTTEISKIKYEW